MARPIGWIYACMVQVAGLGLFPGCVINDPNHCANGGVSCAQMGLVCDPCTPSDMAPGGCVAPEQVGDQDADMPGCQAGGVTGLASTTDGGDSSTSIDPSTDVTTLPLDTGTLDDDSTTTTGPCVSDGECGGPTPFCEMGTCVDCNGTPDPDGACAGAFAGEVCNPESGECVECTFENQSNCDSNTPICGDNNTCVACTAHDQCPGGAGCHLFEGTCLPEDAVVMVEEGGDINSAIVSVDTGTIDISPGVYLDTLQIPPGQVILLRGNSADSTTLLGQGGFAAVIIGPDATLYTSNLAIDNISDAGGVESSGDIWIEDSIIQSNEEGVLSTGGRVHLERTRVIENAGVGVSVGGSDEVVLRNVIIANNGTSASSGFVTTGATPFTITYSTIALNAGVSGEAILSPSGTGVIRNSILVADVTNLDSAVTVGGDVMISDSIVASSAHAAGNVPLIEMMDFMNINLDPGTYEIGAGSTAQDVAIWQTGDPPTDINGVPRPDSDGAIDYAGANIP